MFTPAISRRPQASASAGARFAVPVPSFAPQRVQQPSPIAEAKRSLKTHGDRGSRPAQKPKNETGMPDPLKVGLEQLSGIDLSAIRVHYNASKPGQFSARAYTQGRDIHVAPGEENLLPHEGWHAVQQMQGRVRPTRRLHQIQLNDDSRLEREADAMGAKATAGSFWASQKGKPKAQPLAIPLPNPPLQRKPEEALQFIDDKQNRLSIEREYEIFKSARLASLAPLDILHKTKQYYRLIAALCRTWGTSSANTKPAKPPIFAKFAKIWNKNEKKGLRIDLADLTKNCERDSTPQKSEDLSAWFSKRIAQKRITAPVKQLELLEHLRRNGSKLSEDEELVVRTMFKRTAGFEPFDRQGKSLHTSKTYFRSTATEPAKKILADTIKQGSEKDKFKGLTINTVNREMHKRLGEEKLIDTDLIKLIKEDAGHSASIAVYKSWFHKLASLGLPGNINNTIRTQIQLDRSNVKNSALDLVSQPTEKAPHIPLDLIDMLNGLNPHDYPATNYHDFLLEQSRDTVRAIGGWVNKSYNGIRAIQAPDHPSLILILENGKISERQWREAFVEIFNKTSERNESQLRIAERNSFGFLFPSVSSVGGPVRIWPGLTPRYLFKQLVSLTLKELANTKKELGLEAKKHQSNISTERATETLHVEALKTAIRFVHRVLSHRGQANNLRHGANHALFNWLAGRLRRNLEKASYLLSYRNPEEENHYLKSAGVIENLMEYGYMLSAQIDDNIDDSDDLYISHAEDSLPRHDTTNLRVFYLDSGMQAITLAHIIALKLGARTVHMELPYFETPAVLGKAKIKEVGYDQSPGLVDGDVNPVITSQEAFDQYATKNLDESLRRGAETGAIAILDITNSTLAAAATKLGQYMNYMIVESMSKHYHVGTDKFTMGRLIVVGKRAVEEAKGIVEPVEIQARDPLLNRYRMIMDEVLYGRGNEGQYDIHFNSETLDRINGTEARKVRSMISSPGVSPLSLSLPVNHLRQRSGTMLEETHIPFIFSPEDFATPKMPLRQQKKPVINKTVMGGEIINAKRQLTWPAEDDLDLVNNGQQDPEIQEESQPGTKHTVHKKLKINQTGVPSGNPSKKQEAEATQIYEPLFLPAQTHNPSVFIPDRNVYEIVQELFREEFPEHASGGRGAPTGLVSAPATGQPPESERQLSEEQLYSTPLHQELLNQNEMLRHRLNANHIQVAINNGGGALNCLLISLLQHATRNYRYQFIWEAQYLRFALGLNSGMLGSDNWQFVLLVNTINAIFGVSMRPVFIQAAAHGLPFIIPVIDVGTEEVVIWDQHGHFEALYKA